MQLEGRRQAFVQDLGDKLSSTLVADAKKLLTLVQIRKANEAAQQERLLKDKARAAKEIADNGGKPIIKEDRDDNWNKGTSMSEAPKFTSNRPPRQPEDTGFLSRSEMGTEKPVLEERRPADRVDRPERRPKEDNEGLGFRNQPRESKPV
jgi:hypothetical protein